MTMAPTSGGPPSAPPTDLLAKSAVLRRLELEVTRRLDGRIAGDHLTRATGPGSERAGARAYVPSDDARRIDWNLSARSLQPQVRTTEADRELETWMAVDRSASLDFGTSRREKREVVLAAVAAFGILTVRAGNRIGLVIAGGVRLRHLPPAHSRTGVLAAMATVYDTPRTDAPPAADADLAASLDWLGRTRLRRGQMVVVSDFLDRSDWPAPLRRLALRHQVIAVHVTDPREMALAPVGMLALVDPETGRSLHVQSNSSKLRARYAEAARERQESIRRSLEGAGAEYLHLSTGDDWVLELARFVTDRSRRRQHYLRRQP
jgi:uncharacterized protein (DUF58 family)